jgi:hypothetical protein
MAGKKLPKNEKGEKNRRLSVLVDLQPFVLQNTPELTQLLIAINRFNQFLTIKLAITEQTSHVRTSLDSMFPGVRIAKTPVLEGLTGEQVNLFFWRAICQKLVTSRRASDAATLNAKLSTNNDMLSKAERDTRDLITYLELSNGESEPESSLADPLRLMSSGELNRQIDRAYKAARLSESSFAEEQLFPKLDVFELTMTQGIFANEVVENEFVNQSSLSKLLGSNTI